MPLHALIRHAGTLVEALVREARRIGLVPRASGAEDPLAALCVSEEDVSLILRDLERPTAADDGARAAIDRSRARLEAALGAAPDHGLARLATSFGLAGAALDAFVLALAPDLDVRFARLYGFINNDATRGRPMVAHLALGSLALDATLERALFAPGLLVLDGVPAAPLPARSVAAPEHVVAVCRAAVARAPAGASWAELCLDDEERQALAASFRHELARAPGERLVLVEGVPGSGRLAATRAAALERDRAVEVGTIASAEATLFRARVTGAVAAVRAESLDAQAASSLLAAARRLSVTTLVLVRPGTAEKLDDVAVARIAVGRPGPRQRRALWQRALGDRCSDPVLDVMASAFELSPGRILEVAAELPAGPVDVGAARTVLRRITGERLGTLAALHRGGARLDDLVLEEGVRERLAELVARVRGRYRVLEEWRFGDGPTRGRGVSALFLGPPGTGKTAAAAAIARALELDLYVVDLSRIVSKWVGETEQNLGRLFDEAEASSAALLFDEADALFAKRSTEVKSSSDRYANLTVNYLLQRIETFGGVALLTTNLDSTIDPAFARRFACRVEFALPSAELRATLWRRLLPAGARYAAGVDVRALARSYELPGARIRNALVRAAFRVDEPVLDEATLCWAATAELEDMGRVVVARKPLRATG